jgi:putative hydrolase of the HAD superfamily
MDFDGTLIDSETAFATVWIGLLAERGVSVQVSDLAKYFGASGSQFQAQWEGQLRAWLGNDIDAVALDAEGDDRIAAARLDLPLLPGALELLRTARELNWPIGLATGTGRNLVERDLRRLGVFEWFDVVITIHEVPRPKPAPDIYLEAASRLNVAPVRCVAVEDSPLGCTAALAAGMTVVICPSAVTRALDFPTGALRVSSLGDINLPVLRAS